MRTRFGPPHQIISRIAVLGTVVLLASSYAYITKASVASDGTTGNLDSQTAEEILNLLCELRTQLKKTIVMVTHDPRAAARADRILHLEKGKLVEQVEN